MLCLKMSSGLVRIREPSGAEGLLSQLFNLIENLMKTAATLATENLFTLFIYSVKVHIGLNTQQSLVSTSLPKKTSGSNIYVMQGRDTSIEGR